MSIFNKKIDDISIDDICQFIGEKHSENIRLEYKSGFSTTDVNQQIAKEVSAFANQQGGILIYGVNEELGKTRKPDAIIGIDKYLNPRQKIQSVCIDHIYPPIVPEIQECILKTDGGKVVVVVRVEIGDETPHTINNRTGFYIRSQDRSDPREITDEELELLWNRRAKLIERRELLLRRSYERMFPPDAERFDMLTAVTLRAIPLYPMQPLIDRTTLFDQYRAAEVLGCQGFPLVIGDIKTASDSIYAHITPKKDDTSEFKREEYGEINIFGQVSFIENAIHSFKGNTGILLGWQLKRLLFMIKFLAKWYKNLGYWGLVKFCFDLENCRGVRFYTPHYYVAGAEEMGVVELDRNIHIERVFSIADLIENGDSIVIEIFNEFMWDCGLSVHSGNTFSSSAWVQAEKKEVGSAKCIKCKAKTIFALDEVCDECKRK
jgi:hypothetical protein